MGDVRVTSWAEMDPGVWDCSNCKLTWEFIADGPKENQLNFCPKCGCMVSEFKYMSEEVDGRWQ